MREEYDRLFKAFDEAYKRTQKRELTAKITALDKERDGYAYVMQKVAEAWAAKLEEKSDVVVGELKAAREKLDGHYRAFITYLC